MIAALVLSFVVSDPAAAVGTVRVGRGLLRPTVFLAQDDGRSIRLSGDSVGELKALQSTKVEVIGTVSDNKFVVAHYRIVALPDGTKPTAVGTITLVGEGRIGLAADGGPPIALSAAPRHREVLQAARGSKVWVVGEKLLSGEIKVVRFGILRRAKKETKKPHAEGLEHD